MAPLRSRRAVLASLGVAASAGCSTVLSTDATAELLHTVTATDVATGSSNLAFDVAVADDRITTESTARLRIQYTNTGTDPIGVATSQPEQHTSRSADPGVDGPALLLVPPRRSSSLGRRARDCWRPDGDVHFLLAVLGTEVPPGETLPLEYDVWAHDASPVPCIRPGEYVFDMPEDAGFGLVVENPN